MILLRQKFLEAHSKSVQLCGPLIMLIFSEDHLAYGSSKCGPQIMQNPSLCPQWIKSEAVIS